MPLEVKTLEKSVVFGKLPPMQGKKIAPLLEYHRFPAETVLCKQGQQEDWMFFIEKGEVRAFTQDAAGTQKEYRTLREGDFFGEIALLTNGIRSATVEAVSNVEGWRLPKKHFDAFQAAHPEMIRRMLNTLAHRLATVGNLVSDMVTPGIALKIEDKRSPSEKRVQRFVDKIGTVEFLLANLIGVVVWIILHQHFGKTWDTDVFDFLALTMSVEALIVTGLVLIKQNRDEKDDDIRTDALLQNTIVTVNAVRELREKVVAMEKTPLAASVPEPKTPKPLP